MSIVLENQVKETITKAAVAKSTSLVKGGMGAISDKIETAGAIYGAATNSALALAALPGIAANVVQQVITNVSTYAAEKIAKTMAELIMPPTPEEILGKANKEVSKFLMSVGDIMKELSSNSESLNADDAANKVKNAISEKAKKHLEKVQKLKENVNEIVGDVYDQCKNIQDGILKGEKWLEDNANEIESKAKETIDKLIDEQAGKILAEKQKFIDGIADGIAKRTADVANKALKKITKEKLDKINAAKQKAIAKAKAAIGKATLNLMALLGL